MKSGSYVKIGGSEVDKLVKWGLGVVEADFAADPAINIGVSLGKFGLGPAYERTTLFSKFYKAGSIPPDEEIEADLVRFVSSLARLYEEADHGGEPGAPGPEARDLEAFLNPMGRGSKGQGRGLNAVARKAVEKAAMVRAESWLKDEGFKFKNVSARDCCDFRAHRDGEEWVIEVKGTTGRASSVLLTRNEVALHRAAHPKNVLLIVHSLKLAGDGTKAEGGELVVHYPWELQEGRLSSICFEYRFD